MHEVKRSVSSQKRMQQSLKHSKVRAADLFFWKRIPQQLFLILKIYMHKLPTKVSMTISGYAID